jgi:hypothetical protein
MVAALALGRRAGQPVEPPPLELERALERDVGVAGETDLAAERGLALGAHLALAAGFGAAYGLLRAALAARPLPAGPLYGLGVYAISLVGVGPALGLTGGPWGERTPTAFRRVLLHLVYGTVTAVVDERLRGRAG